MRIFIVLGVCFALCACGGSGGSSTPGNTSVNTGSTVIADYKGQYKGTVDYNLVEYVSTGVPIQADVGTDGKLTNVIINGNSTDASASTVISSSGTDNNGIIKGQGSFIITGKQINVTYTGKIDIVSGSVYIAYNVSGGLTGTIVIKGNRIQPIDTNLAVWTKTGTISSNSSEMVFNIAVDPNNSQNIYASTYTLSGKQGYPDFSGYLYKSSNGGTSWTRYTNPFSTSKSGFQIVFGGPKIIYTVTDNGFYKSVDDGVSWTRILEQIFSLAIAPNNNQIIFAATNTGLKKSTDGGLTWVLSSNGLLNVFIYALEIDRTNSQVIYAGTNKGVFKSSNGGSNWISASNGIPISSFKVLVIDPTNSQIIYAGADSGDGGGLYKSTDSGNSWTVASSGLSSLVNFFSSLVVDPTNNQVIYAVTGSYLFKSTNGGASWAQAYVSYNSTGAFAIDPNNSDILYAGNGGEVLKGTIVRQ